MGFTIEDMLTIGRDKYNMEIIAGRDGWANSISWLHVVEDTTLIQNFWGREMAVTTGLGFATEEKQKALVEDLIAHHAAGLVINTGKYIPVVPKEVMNICDANDFPLLTVPWEVHLADLMKDFSIRVFLQDGEDQKISTAMIQAITEPEHQEHYRDALKPFFDVDGSFQTVLITTDGLDTMDTVERRKLSNQMQVYLEGISHNGNFFYYDSSFVLVMNDIEDEDRRSIVEGMVRRAQMRTSKEIPFYVGVGTKVIDVANLYMSFHRAESAMIRAMKLKKSVVRFDEMGVYRLLYSIPDKKLLEEMRDEPLRPLLEYDEKHKSNLVETLEMYLNCDGSIKQMAAEMYTHRNTVIYRVNKIKEMLGTDFSSPQDRLKYQVAFYIRKM
ncbi:MAG: PucR family transcriptional regulator ligand-binding domain-containing protein [Lachnospiraceae bacterium]|nr:PucR family transcriptional regulator ligand-binding domain-containing protein [Lachnospiraceae bacterium]